MNSKELPTVERSFVVVAKIGELAENGKKLVQVAGKSILLVYSEGQYFAIDKLCTHDHEQLLGGAVRKCTILCPIHGARFSLKNGRPFGPPAFEALTTYPVRVEGDEIQVCATPA